jgi:glucokinase
MSSVALGIDIGGTNTVFGLIDEHGKEHFNGSLKTKDFDHPADLALAIFKETESPLMNHHLAGIGIGAPNGNIHSGCIEFAPNLVWKGIVPLRDIFESQFKVTTTVTNDANAAAIGEMKFGAAKNLQDFILITLGTGLGSGFVSNGQLVYGHDGMAGELGHIIVEENGRLCGCGRNGCLETYASSSGFLKTAQELISKSTRNSLLHKIASNDLQGEDITKAAIEQDELALEVFDFTAEYLARGLATAVAITSPDTIIFFGGLAHAQQLLLNPTKIHLEARLLNIYQNKVKLIPSALLHRNAAILGAAALVWQ